MANEQMQSGREGYQFDKIIYAKGGVNLNTYMCAQGRRGWGWGGDDKKIGHRIRTHVLNGWPPSK